MTTRCKDPIGGTSSFGIDSGEGTGAGSGAAAFIVVSGVLLPVIALGSLTKLRTPRATMARTSTPQNPIAICRRRPLVVAPNRSGITLPLAGGEQVLLRQPAGEEPVLQVGPASVPVAVPGRRHLEREVRPVRRLRSFGSGSSAGPPDDASSASEPDTVSDVADELAAPVFSDMGSDEASAFGLEVSFSAFKLESRDTVESVGGPGRRIGALDIRGGL